LDARKVVSAATAGVTALIVGTLIATVSRAAQTTTVASAASVPTEATVAATADAQLPAYRANLQDALVKLDTAYRALQDRDTAYRALVGKVDGNAAALATANQELAAKLAAAYAEVQQLTALVQQAEAAGSAPGTTTAAPAGRERESEDGDD